MSETRKDCSYNYTVRRGDSFYLISQRTGVQLRDLLEANPDIPPARLTVGDVLHIPYCSAADKPAGEQPGQGGGNAGGTPPESNCCPQDNGGNQQENGGGYVCPANRRAVVQEGQTAGDLQLRYNLSYHTLKTANAGKDLEDLNGGDIVCIPESNIACPLPASVVLGEGDTLEAVAMRYSVPIAALLRANPCLAPEDFKAGISVRLPD